MIYWTNGLKKFFQLPFKEQAMLVEAFVCLMIARPITLIFPFSKIAPRLGKHMKETAKDRQLQQKETLIRIKRSISRASSRTPWESKCLVQAIAGKMMLKRRKIPSTLYLGVARNEEKENDLKAHAWLRCGNIILTGKAGSKQYKVVSTFGEEDK